MVLVMLFPSGNEFPADDGMALDLEPLSFHIFDQGEQGLCFLPAPAQRKGHHRIAWTHVEVEERRALSAS